MTDGFDVIGDIHGHAAKLTELLAQLGYTERDGIWRHPRRQAVFVGDLIDRGPHQLDVITIVRSMVDAGAAHVVAGNHEFNAIAFHTPHPERPGEYLRPHSPKNLRQHQEFLDQVVTWSPRHEECIRWFKTLPLWLELDGLRVVHACWDPAAMAVIRDLAPRPALTDDVVLSASTPGSSAWRAVEHLLKGPEIELAPHAPPYLDKDGHLREHARFQWWAAEADRLDVAALIPGGVTTSDGEPYPALTPVPVESPVPPYRDRVPVIFGHYWATGDPAVTSDRTACVDYSAGKGGPLVAYRWSGEATLVDDHFVSSADGR